MFYEAVILDAYGHFVDCSRLSCLPAAAEWLEEWVRHSSLNKGKRLTLQIWEGQRGRDATVLVGHQNYCA